VLGKPSSCWAHHSCLPTHLALELLVVLCNSLQVRNAGVILKLKDALVLEVGRPAKACVLVQASAVRMLLLTHYKAGMQEWLVGSRCAVRAGNAEGQRAHPKQRAWPFGGHGMHTQPCKSWLCKG